MTWTRIVLVDRVGGEASDAAAIIRRPGGASAALWIAPPPDGHPLGGTTVVAADVAEAAPSAFRAVTVTRSVCPTSPVVTV